MKLLNKEEFSERAIDQLRARRIFIDTGITDRLDIAFEIYENMIAKKKKKTHISTREAGSGSGNLIAPGDRMPCPGCGRPMYLKRVPKNQTGYQTRIQCVGFNCDQAFDTQLSIEYLVEYFRRISGLDWTTLLSQMHEITKQTPLPGMIESQEPTTCPECWKNEVLVVKGCCGAPNGYLWCAFCGWEEIL